jgi:hypothetical protein
MLMLLSFIVVDEERFILAWSIFFKKWAFKITVYLFSLSFLVSV